MNRALQPVFALTLFTSAFLIFTVQPMASKMLLPLLGGSPSVWNTAMVFFQAMLLAGYAYAHLISKYLPLRAQAVLHIVLLGLFTVVLPLALPADAQPPAQGGQALWQLGIMLTCIGGPFFILAASAPLFQYWFASSGHKNAENPYFLYAVSNTGSMLALLGYPLLLEPLLTLSQQTWGWFGGYVALIALVHLCGVLVRNGVKPVPASVNAQAAETPTWKKRLIWTFLAFLPSSLMLGVTTIITTDLASAPLFWILPLTIYLLTFIIAFAGKPVMGVRITRELTAYILCLLMLSFMLSGFITLQIPMIIVHLVTFFLCALLCHGELAQSKPAPAYLTEYFLIISLGGVLGGIFNALIAPQIFTAPIEYSLSLAAIAFVIWIGYSTEKKMPLSVPRKDMLLIAGGLALCLLVYYAGDNTIQLIGTLVIFGYLFVMVPRRAVFAFVSLACLFFFHSAIWSTDKILLAQDRNYFGIIKVYEQKGIHFFYHGTTLHGAQAQNEADEFTPVTYYSPGSGASDAFAELSRRKKGPQNVAILGLGVGSVACFKAPDRHFDFYEIDSAVAEYAENPNYFSYLSGCGSPYDVIIGDGRLKIMDKPDKSYDMIFLDAFSSDNIPIHVMTTEAFEGYFRKLAPGGILIANISNRYLDLRPVLNAIGKQLGFTMYFKYHKPVQEKDGVSQIYTESIFAVMAKDEKELAAFTKDKGWQPYTGKKQVRAWTDDYANILSSFNFLP